MRYHVVVVVVVVAVVAVEMRWPTRAHSKLLNLIFIPERAISNKQIT